MEETHIQISTENPSGNCLMLYDGKFGDTDFVNRDVVAGELLQYTLKRFREFNIIEDTDTSVGKGAKIVIKFWKEKLVQKIK